MTQWTKKDLVACMGPEYRAYNDMWIPGHGDMKYRVYGCASTFNLKRVTVDMTGNVFVFDEMGCRAFVDGVLHYSDYSDRGYGDIYKRTHDGKYLHLTLNTGVVERIVIENDRPGGEGRLDDLGDYDMEPGTWYQWNWIGRTSCT